MDDLTCCNCGGKAVYSNRRRYTDAKRLGRAYCSEACKKRYHSKRSAETMRATNLRYRDAIVRRMIERNPMADHKNIETMVAKTKGRTFLGRGGNGQPTKQQLLLHDHTGLPMEHPISLKAARGHFESVPKNYKVDLADPRVKLAIEVDGKSHRLRKWRFLDQRKTAILGFLGWHVLRFTNEEVDADLSGRLLRIWSTIFMLKATTTTLPTAS
jgi:hypothetical protein